MEIFFSWGYGHYMDNFHKNTGLEVSSIFNCIFGF